MQRFLRILLGVLGGALGVGIYMILDATGVLPAMGKGLHFVGYIVSGFLPFLIAFLLAPRVIARVQRLIEQVDTTLSSVPASDVLLGTAGLVIGFVIAWLISTPISSLTIPFVGNILGVLLSVLIFIVFGILGVRLMLRNKEDLFRGVRRMRMSAQERRQEKMRRTEELPRINGDVIPKVMDTSAIIDGRIFEVIRAGFVDGPIILSTYVLEELQHIADSSDPQRRERGRRGLDQVKELQASGEIEVIVDETRIEKVDEVDAKLLVLTKKCHGKIITTDYNLNKVASVQSLPVLNVNDLANALKPIVIPGERMTVSVLKEGKSPEQGLAYLDDGTMVVVENGRSYIGQTVEAVVTSALQTAAGKMIFVRVS